MKALSENHSTPNRADRGRGKGTGIGRGGRNNNDHGNQQQNHHHQKRVNFKEEAKNGEATTQQLIDQSQQTSPMLNVSDS